MPRRARVRSYGMRVANSPVRPTARTSRPAWFSDAGRGAYRTAWPSACAPWPHRSGRPSSRLAGRSAPGRDLARASCGAMGLIRNATSRPVRSYGMRVANSPVRPTARTPRPAWFSDAGRGAYRATWPSACAPWPHRSGRPAVSLVGAHPGATSQERPAARWAFSGMPRRARVRSYGIRVPSSPVRPTARTPRPAARP
ncbi:hypothetical protein FHY22_003729 [Xanthomonas arboricola]|nr:hypothetical protein [Xanthomonas arboricola]